MAGPNPQEREAGTHRCGVAITVPERITRLGNCSNLTLWAVALEEARGDLPEGRLTGQCTSRQPVNVDS